MYLHASINWHGNKYRIFYDDLWCILEINLYRNECVNISKCILNYGSKKIKSLNL